MQRKSSGMSAPYPLAAQVSRGKNMIIIFDNNYEIHYIYALSRYFPENNFFETQKYRANTVMIWDIFRHARQWKNIWGDLPRDDDKIMSGYLGLVAIWVTHPLCPQRIPLGFKVSVIFAKYSLRPEPLDQAVAPGKKKENQSLTNDN